MEGDVSFDSAEKFDEYAIEFHRNKQDPAHHLYSDKLKYTIQPAEGILSGDNHVSEIHKSFMLLLD